MSMKMTQFARFANDATKQILGASGLIRENLQSMFSYPNAINVLDPVTVSGSLIHIDDSAPLNAKQAKIYIEPLQKGSGVPSLDNIRPIIGWTGANVVRCGKNLFDKNDDFEMVDCYNYRMELISRRGVTFNLTPGYYTLKAEKTPDSTGAYINYCRINPDGSYGGWSSLVNVDSVFERTFTVTERQTLVIYDQQASSINMPTSFDKYNIQFEIGSTSTPYEPYVGNTYNITFPSEVETLYGGTLDITNGILTVNKQYIKKKLSDGVKTAGDVLESYLYNTPFLYDSTPLSSSIGKICNICPYAYTGDSMGTPHFYCNRTTLVIYVPTGTDENTEIEVCIPIVTPISYQFTPTEILMFNGINTVYADCGSMEIEYYRHEGGGHPYD